MKKNIIIVTKALWIGGIETALVNLLNHFDYGRYNVTLLVLHAELDMLNQINSKCRVVIADRDKLVTFKDKYQYSRLYHLTEESEHPSSFHKMMMWSVPAIKFLENKLYIKYIKRLLKQASFDSCIIYSDVVGEIAIRAIRADKYIMYYHHGAMRHVYHDQIPWKKCNHVIAVSNNQAQLIKGFFPKYYDKLEVVHNLTDVHGIRTKAEATIPEQFEEDRYNIVSVGRVSHEKGMDIAVQVCSKLVENGFKNVYWWIVGDGPDMQEVYDMIKATHMEAYVRTVGMKSNPYPYIKRADLYVQPSRFEGYPLTILEALILGQPVVSTNNNGAREIIEHGITGLLIPNDIERLTKAIIELLNQPEKQVYMRAAVQKIDFEIKNQKEIEKLENLI